MKNSELSSKLLKLINYATLKELSNTDKVYLVESTKMLALALLTETEENKYLHAEKNIIENVSSVLKILSNASNKFTDAEIKEIKKKIYCREDFLFENPLLLMWLEMIADEKKLEKKLSNLKDLEYNTLNTLNLPTVSPPLSEEALCRVLTLLKCANSEKFGKEIVIYDPAAGTGDLLIRATTELQKEFPNKKIKALGQELFENIVVEAKLRTFSFKNIRITSKNSLIYDQYSDSKADIVICEPPLGLQWEYFKDQISESAINELRFPLPAFTEGHWLFALKALSKIKAHGTVFIILPVKGFNSKLSLRLKRKLIESGVLKSVVSIDKNLLVLVLEKTSSVKKFNSTPFFRLQGKPNIDLAIDYLSNVTPFERDKQEVLDVNLITTYNY